MPRLSSFISGKFALVASIGAGILCACSPIEPPIVDASALPDTSNSTGPYQVTARVEGARDISSVVLVWENLAESDVQAVRTPMTQDSSGSGAWNGSIPGQGVGALIAFHVEATDVSGDTGFDPEQGSTAQCGDNDCFHVVSP